MNKSTRSERFQLGFFGKRNAGKSSLMNAFSNQEISIVSPVGGTTTDPVYKTMEILPIGPVTLIDTPGLDDEGELGAMRVKRALNALKRIDGAILVVDSSKGMGKEEQDLIEKFETEEIPYVIASNKCDESGKVYEDGVNVSAKTKEGIEELREKVAKLRKEEEKKRIIGDMYPEKSLFVLVTPIDSAAPKGRLILPQQQVIRDILDSGSMALVLKESELEEGLKRIGKENVALVITDSQAFKFVSSVVPEDVPLTSFSILMARYKGFLNTAVKGVFALNTLNEGDEILIAEGCTHHRQCGDIGRDKIPALIKKVTGKDFKYTFSSGLGFPEDFGKIKLVIHCGGCMLLEKEVKNRMNETISHGIPFTNYGITLAYLTGILKRSISIFPELSSLL